MSSSTAHLRQSSAQEAVFFPASFAQQRLWFLDQLTPGRATYNIFGALRIRGKLDVDVLEKTLNEVVRRHETLRTRFVAVGSQPQQVIEDRVNVQLPVLDLSIIVGEEEQEAEAMRLAQKEARQPFDLQQAPLFRGKLLRLSPLHHVLLFTMHHIISDGWSIGVLIEEISILYETFSAGQPSPLPELPIQYADYSMWQRECLEGGVLEPQLAYWTQQLAGSSMLQLPTDRPRPASQTQNGATYDFVISENITHQLKKLAEEQGATLFMVLLAAFQVLLHRYSSQEDIAVGTPIAGRSSSETEKLIGFFINTLVLRLDLSGRPSFTELLKRVKEVTLGAYAHQDIPFQTLVEVLSPERNMSSTPLFQVMITLQNAPQSDLRLGAASLQPLNSVDNETSKFDLSLQLGEDGSEALISSLQYNTDLFDAVTIQRMIGHYSRLLSGVISAPHAPIRSLEILSPEERRTLLQDFNATAAFIPEKTITRLFEEQVDRTPNATAVRCGEDSLSYIELDQRSNQLAHYLKQRGVGPERLVGICLNRSLDMLVALLGILKSGGAYVPLDPSCPVERLGFMLGDAQILVLLTQASLRNSFATTMAQIISMDEDWKEISRNSAARVSGCLHSSNLAYVIYTSGSTGQPKGVGVTHNGMVNYVHWASQRYRMSQGSGSPVHSSLAFDLTVTSIYPALIAGGCVEVLRQSAGMEELALQLEASDYSLLKLTPSHLRMLGQLLRKNKQGEQGAHALVIGGETLRYSDLEQWRKPGAKTRLINEYGPTETVVGSTIYEVQDEYQLGDVPVGKPIVNTEIYILGPDMEPLPVGVPGELYIGGAGLARGYVNRPSLTAERFIPNPYRGVGARLYATGDLARWCGDGNLEYLGRNDQQVKIRGFRIELGEIESVLERHPSVAQSVVLARDSQSGERRLVAYIVRRDGVAAPSVSGLEEYLKAGLPEYMVPTVFVELERWPLTHNGKIDWKKLPQPDAHAPEQEYVPPRCATEETLCRVWQEVLHVERVGIHDNFFKIGGHSLLAAQVATRMRAAFRVDVPLRQLFEAPTIAELVKIVEQLMETSAGQKVPPMVRTPRDRELPLSFAQQRLWFIDQLMPGNTFYNVPNFVRIGGLLDLAVVERVFREIMRRHETLRTHFVTVEGEPRQIIEKEASLHLGLVSLTSLPEEEREAEARKLAKEDAQTSFDLSQGPLLRVKLLRLAEQDHVLLLNMHHIVSDGWSMGVLIKELSVLHRAFSAGQPSPLPELPIQYADFNVWQRSWLTGDVLEQQLDYWRQQLQGAPPALELPLDRPRPMALSARGAQQKVCLETELAGRLRTLAQEHGATLYMILLAVFQALLYRYTGQDDISVGSPIAGRTQIETEGLIGFFVNTLVMRTRFSGEWSFNELLRHVKAVTLEAYAHQDVPFEKVVEVLSSKRDLSRTALFQVMLALQNAPFSELELGPAKLSTFEVDSGTAKFELLLSLVETQSGIQGDLEYNTDLFDDETIARLLLHYRTLLCGALDNPRQPLATLPLLTDSEKQQQLIEWNRTESEYPRDKCLHDAIEEQVDRTPDIMAIAGDRIELTYAELNRRANHLAHYLRKMGIGPEVRIGICVERDPEMFVAILGVLKCGGAFVPLDPNYPAERLIYMLEDARAPLLLTQQNLRIQLPSYAGTIVRLDEQWKEIGLESSKNPVKLSLPENLAYVIYTSGSTGRPKGVAICHRSVVGFVSWMHEIYTSEEMAGVLAATSICFDLSFLEIFVPLTRGGTIFVAQNALDLAGMEMRDQIKCVTTVPSAIRDLVRMKAVPESVRTINLAGEALHSALVREIFELNTIERVYNLYGPSEDTVFSTYAPLNPAKEHSVVPIGRPVANRQVYVLNDWMEPAPAGVAGELYIGGEGLARGYLARPALTAERFVPNPFSRCAGERLYRTGDLVRSLKDGNLEFLGRVDHQVKIRGYRIELGEIEAVLLGSGQVEQAVVVAREDEPGEKLLVAYVVPRSGITEGQLRGTIGQRLPEFMVPSIFVVLESLPLTPNGKIDRQSLPSPISDRVTRENIYVAPRTTTEELLANIWSALLKREPISIHDNFFKIGGHSLLAARVASRMRESFKVQIPLRRMFEAPTIAQLAQVIDQALNTTALTGAQPHALPSIKRLARPTSAQEAVFSASFAQQRLWFLDQLTPGRATYNMPTALRIRGRLDVDMLERAVAEVVRRHETLRTRFVVVSGRPQQVIRNQAGIHLPVSDLTSLGGQEEQEKEAIRLAREEAQQPFDLQQTPLIRGKLLRLGALDHVLLFTMHHIISDAWSIGVLVEEVSALYDAFSSGGPSPLPELPIQYADYSEWQRAYLEAGMFEQQLAYWKEQLAGSTMLMLPTDYPRPISQGQTGATSEFLIAANLTSNLKQLAAERGASLFMVLLAAFQILLYRYSGQDDVAVGTPIAGRSGSETEKLIGFFINTLVLRADLSGVPSFTDLLQKIKELTLEAYAHQDVPFEKLVEVLSPERNLGSTPLFQVMLTLQNVPQSDLRLGAAALLPFNTVGNGTAKFDLLLELAEDGSGTLMSSLEYNTDLFAAASITRIIDHYRMLLIGIVANPGQSIAALPLLTTNERKQVVQEWNETAVAFPRRACVPDLIEEQVTRTPDAKAVECEGEDLSYRELNGRANQLAWRLRELGVGPETRVGLMLERSVEMVVGLLGVLKTGGAYVPLDSDYPPERLSYMLQSAQITVLLTQARLRQQLRSYGGQILILELDGGEERSRIAAQSDQNLGVEFLPEYVAYLIYTSGSTGKPKGVMNSHGGLLNRLLWMQEQYRLGPTDVVLQKTPFSFDVSVWEFFWPVLEGAKLVVARPGGHQDPAYLARLIEDRKITTLHFVPPMLALFLDDERSRQCKSIRRIMCSGEALPPELARRCLASMPWAELHNLYGPTEAAIDATYWKCFAEDTRPSVPIGKAIANIRLYVVDQEMGPVPVGVPGELCLAGVGLARGYWGRGDLTAERFVPDGLSGRTGERLYRTGDLVRWLADGNVEYLGRLDQQVKIRGFRIELGEIEAALQEHAAVRRAVVIAQMSEAGDKRLVAYVVAEPMDVESDQENGRAGLRSNELREHLRGKLPEYMVPSAFVQLEKLPLNPNGKIDRKNLPQPVMETPEREYVEPRHATEGTLCRLWQELLRRERVGIHDNFFELGGHSLLAVRLRTMIYDAFGWEMPLASLFQHPTVAQLAELVAQSPQPPEESSSRVLVNIQSEGSGAPFFCVHPIGGSVLCYAELAKALGRERPFYGLQSVVPKSGFNSRMSIEQMAALYVKEIRQIQPTGPYLLGGWSIGGLVAFEMAKQLTEQGETIGLLAMFDTHPPRVEENTDLPMLARFAADLSRQMGVDTRVLGRQFLQLPPNEQWNLVQETLIREGLLAIDSAQRQLTSLLDVFTENSTAIDAYTLEKTEQQVILFRASEGQSRRDLASEWSNWVGGRLEFHLVPGDHYTIMKQPYVSAIAGGLQRYLVAAECNAKGQTHQAIAI